jgi:hypothetical protein
MQLLGGGFGLGAVRPMGQITTVNGAIGRPDDAALVVVLLDGRGRAGA